MGSRPAVSQTGPFLSGPSLNCYLCPWTHNALHVILQNCSGLNCIVPNSTATKPHTTSPGKTGKLSLEAGASKEVFLVVAMLLCVILSVITILLQNYFIVIPASCYVQIPKYTPGVLYNIVLVCCVVKYTQ